MKVSKLVFNPFEENTYILWDEGSKDSIVIDPGMFDDNERRQFDEYMESLQLNVNQILLTHLHLDHAASAKYVSERYGAKICANAKDAQLGLLLSQQAKMFGFELSLPSVVIDTYLSDGDMIEVENEHISVIETPGHTQGGLSFYVKESSIVFVGDTLFMQSIGRTDLPGGDHMQLMDSIKNKLFSLPDETLVLCGHGGGTTIGDEKSYNPYIVNSR